MHKFFILIHLLHSSICFEHYCAHIQKDNCINTASGIVTLFGWLFSTQCIKIKNLCIKLVKKKDYHYIRMHGQQNVKTFNLVTNVVKTALLRKRMAVNFENHAKPIKCNMCVCVCVCGEKVDWNMKQVVHILTTVTALTCADAGARIWGLPRRHGHRESITSGPRTAVQGESLIWLLHPGGAPSGPQLQAVRLSAGN